MVARMMEAGRAACDREKTRPAAQPDTPPALTRNVYLQSILIGTRAGSVQIVEEALKAAADVFDIHVQVFQESLYEVGRLWETGKISVSVEYNGDHAVRYGANILGSYAGAAIKSAPSSHCHRCRGRVASDRREHGRGRTGKCRVEC